MEGDLLFGDRFGAHGSDQPFHFVFELACVAGPIIGGESIHCRGAELLGFGGHRGAMLLQKMVGKDRNVAAYISQRRSLDADDA